MSYPSIYGFYVVEYWPVDIVNFLRCRCVLRLCLHALRGETLAKVCKQLAEDMFSFGFSFDHAESGASAGSGSASSVPECVAVPPPKIPLSLVDLAHVAPPAATELRVVPFCHGLRQCLVDVDAVSGVRRDVVQGEYEGGAKVWECTSDVIEWLLSGAASDAFRPGCRVLDLGCGAAMLAAFALSRGAGHVTCQDLNISVLRDVSAPNLRLNMSPSSAAEAATAPQAVQLLAGPWETLAAALASDGLPDAAASSVDSAADPSVTWLRSSVDLLLASEVLYRESHYEPLLSIIRSALKPAGIAVIGSKRTYFGAELGGSSLSFVDFVNGKASSSAGAAASAAAGAGSPAEPADAASTTAKRLHASIAATLEDGRSMTRDIIVVRWA